MNRKMKQWVADCIASSECRAMPILSFPAVSLMGITVKELISDSSLQARAMETVARQVDSVAAVSLMDLSVEAECFGGTVHVSDDEVPTIVGSLVSTPEEVERLVIPAVGTGRSGLYVDAVSQAVELIRDRPVFAGMIGPFSLAGRLMDITGIMMACYESPETVHTLLDKTTSFLEEYALAFKRAGADGVVMAEPMAGLLSPEFGDEFSSRYVKHIVERVQDDDFIVIYHNCGGSAVHMVDSIAGTGAAALHFGNAVDMADVMPQVPPHVLAMGNVDPSGQFREGTPESIRATTVALLGKCAKWPNFMISSGCDIPPSTSWENIRAFFEAVREFDPHL
ncbi:uroporphyrinogen decarboxylase family protein [Akkermansia sp. N21116]|uniref:uroporphyrinogen decarboxylase family protein n=1 Tax=Akkermansia sp. N21116 TaxID=3040764 RepID=UPI00244E6B2A|nr:uroporphyrinogen decarboxylase family protein [Akkermansia sp. N21116]WPX40721.1 uroporphyrinogen decarboxylase family protein [Akkermansia sp. N21116]